jgi:hypothetical protein
MLVALAGALLLAACNPAAQTDAATKQIEAFHASYNAGDIDAMYSAGNDAFHQSVTREQLAGLVEIVTAKLGKVVSAEQTGFNTANDNGVNTTTITMKTKFENGEGEETFIFQGDGDRMQLLNWNLKSEQHKEQPEDASADEAITEETTNTTTEEITTEESVIEDMDETDAGDER